MEKLHYNNIFEAITDDSSEAADLEFRADIIIVLRSHFKSKGWKQKDVMANLGISQPRASELEKGKVDKFSSDKLIGLLSKIGYKIKPRLNMEDDKKPVFECTALLIKK